MIDRIEVSKSKHEMSVFSNGLIIKKYKISIGSGGIGEKQWEGDKKTPEGVYFINSKNAGSDFHKNLGISYPNEDDVQRAKGLGKKTGGDIKIHGLRNGQEFIGRFQRWRDWTTGCISLTNDEIDDLYLHTPIGIPILIRP